jgi:hypothetical protein
MLMKIYIHYVNENLYILIYIYYQTENLEVSENL